MIIAIYKPEGPTSNDVVQMVKRATGAKKVGHAGTLDPLARGVLVLGIGREATKKLSEVVRKEKEYVASIKLGQTSITDDQEGVSAKAQEESKNTVDRPGQQKIDKILQKFVGKITQTPPLYSAVKIKGKEAYKYARRGQKVELTPRVVEIKSIELLEYEWPVLKIKVITGPGVYIRSLARDIGQELGTGAYLADLERTRVGQWTKDKAVSLEKLPTRYSLNSTSR